MACQLYPYTRVPTQFLRYREESRVPLRITHLTLLREAFSVYCKNRTKLILCGQRHTIIMEQLVQ
jgi:hypothetical protein